MRDLNDLELTYVSGAGSSCSPSPPSKNNNGYGNGAESGPPPGNSGDHNPGLLEDNLGPKGAR